jgi:cobalamin-dependent methionine synthase I
MGMENWAKELLLSGEPLLSYVVNTVASIVVEKAVDFLHDHIREQMKERGLKITNRYSPGYCNWPVSEQQFLFSLLPENFCGITLTESSLMLPIKSISGIIGIGSLVKMKEYICDKCGIKECTYRAKRPVFGKKNETR